ncbi:MAG: hypothetical protein COB06_022600, partial [Pseudomonas sp.]|nr:hypothetical protein [Pseudomonas sp.]
EDSLTYYGMSVNDVFAYYLTGQKAKPNAFKGTDIVDNFPTTHDEIIIVSDYVKKKFPAEELVAEQALAMEIKTSWVDAETVDDKSQYLIIWANVPAYNRKYSTTMWPLLRNSTQIKELALVGMHVVGSVKGHPELVWSTFEHVDNAPNGSYTYLGSDNVIYVIDNSYTNKGDWIFHKTDGGEQLDSIPEYQKVCSKKDKLKVKNCVQVGDIYALEKDGQANIRAVDLVRLDPWGGLPNGSRSVGEEDRISNATQLISVNSTVMTALADVGDVRANYFQVGGVWASGGVENIPVTKDDAKGEEMRGSLHLSNATMETYHQFSDIREGNTSVNCFSCHTAKEVDKGKGKKEVQGIYISHIFDKLMPLNIPVPID